MKAVVKKSAEILKKQCMKLPARSTSQTSSDHRPDLDANIITMFQELIGELRWDIEISRVDILHEVSVLSTFQVSPREGRLHQMFYRFYLMKNNPKLTIYFYPRSPNIYPTSFSGSPAEAFREKSRCHGIITKIYTITNRYASYYY